MTTKGEAQARRRQLVRLSVLATSSLALAASWIGVVAVDGAGQSKPAMAAVQVSATFALPPAPGVMANQQSVIPNAAASNLVPAPAPAPTRQVVIVRRSRAS